MARKKQDQKIIRVPHKRLFEILRSFQLDDYDFVALSEIVWRYNRTYIDEDRTKESVAENLKFFRKLGLVDYGKSPQRTEGFWRLRKNADVERLRRFSKLPMPENKVLLHE